ncbi:MAG: polysaccharide biosynthesis tyrosine autokinase [Myxococcales bacterium]|nr:polysaccharide biosynthesis tyrosine autokinase [Myxococcales bacterium]
MNVGPGANDGSFSIQRYLRTLTKRKWTIIFTMALITVGVAFYTTRQPKIYVATATIVIEPRAPLIMAGSQQVIQLGATGYFERRQFFATQLKVIKSRTIAKRVIEAKNLRNRPELLGLGKRKVTDLEAYIIKRVKVEPVKESMMVHISVEDTNRRVASMLANEIARQYEKYNIRRLGQKSSEVKVWLKKKIEDEQRLKDKLEKAILEIENNSKLDPDSLKELATQTKEHSIQYSRAIEAVLKNRAIVSQIKIFSTGKNLTDVPLGSAINNELIAALKMEAIKLENRYRDLAESYGAKHPKILSVKKQLTLVRLKLRGEIERILKSYELEYRAAMRLERSLVGKLTTLREKRLNMRQLLQRYNRKVSEYNDVKEGLKQLIRQYQNINLTSTATAELKQANNVYVLDPAKPPLEPVKPRVKLNILLGFIFGLFGGVGLAFFFEFVDNTVKGREDIEELLGLSFLGIVPNVKESKARKYKNPELFVHHEPKSTEAEFCRSIRTNLLFMTPESESKTFLVTSASPQEGKTTTAVSIAITMASSGMPTLILDTDMRRPRLHRVFGVSNEVGLSSYLIENKDIGEYIKKTEVPNVDLLPCGPLPPNPAELLHTKKFQELVTILQQRYKNLIFDSPPLGAVTDPVVISSYVDGVIIIAKYGKTSREALRHAKQTFERTSARILGVVLNRLDLQSRGYGYYYYYDQYGRYYGEQPAKGSS